MKCLFRIGRGKFCTLNGAAQGKMICYSRLIIQGGELLIKKTLGFGECPKFFTRDGAEGVDLVTSKRG